MGERGPAAPAARSSTAGSPASASRVEYGGQGLTRAHQQAFTQESLRYQMPTLFNVPTLSILAPTLLDFGTEEQKQRHIPAILRGEELWVQFLSEPSGGSDLAGLVTRATRDGDVFVLNGSKIWSSGAFRSDYAMCLARTDWQRAQAPGPDHVHRQDPPAGHRGAADHRWSTASPSSARSSSTTWPSRPPTWSGEVNDGWTVASRLLFHERDAVGGGSPYVSGLAPWAAPARGDTAPTCSTWPGPPARPTTRVVRQLVAEDRVNDRVQHQLTDRVTTGIRTGAFPAPAGAIPRLFAATNSERHFDIGLEIAGRPPGRRMDDDPAGRSASSTCTRQSGSLGGGSNEMQRNIISERVLGMPREYAADRDEPFDEVRHN